MIRTQIRLNKEEYEAAKAEAERLGIPLAELVRRSLHTLLRDNSARPWMRFAGMIDSGHCDAERTIDDDVVYDKRDCK